MQRDNFFCHSQKARIKKLEKFCSTGNVKFLQKIMKLHPLLLLVTIVQLTLSFNYSMAWHKKTELTDRQPWNMWRAKFCQRLLLFPLWLIQSQKQGQDIEKMQVISHFFLSSHTFEILCYILSIVWFCRFQWPVTFAYTDKFQSFICFNYVSI